MKTNRQYLKDYTKPTHKIEKCSFYFNLHETATSVKSEMFFVQNSDLNTLTLNGENLTLKKIKLNDTELKSSEFEVNQNSLTLFKTPEKFKLSLEVEINPEANKSCEGLYLSQGIFCTQCEAESFRKITYFLDRPDVMTSYTVEIEADEKKYPILLSNGDCVDKKSLGQGRHYSKWVDPFAKPSYLFALVAGDMGVVTDTFKTMSGKNVKLDVYAPHGKQSRSLHAMKSLKEAMEWDEKTFGLEYDLNQYMIVSIDDFNMGAMENKGLNVFNSKLVLADTKSATDNDFHNIQSVVGHEYFHNWTGNRVTCRNWFELSLKEGLTVFRDQEFSGDMTSHVVQRIRDVDSLRTRQFSEDSSPNAHAVRPESCLAVDNFYTATIYEKGAEVIRMMQTLVGRDGFKKGMKLYFERHDGQAVTIEDFVAAISDANQTDFTQFKLWYSQAGTPTVTVHENYDANKNVYTLKLTQTCPLTQTESENKTFVKKPFLIPLKFGLIYSHGEKIKTEKDILLLAQQQQEWIFENIQHKPILSLNRNFSAPIKVVHSMEYADILSLIKHDADTFNRREYGMKMLLDETRRLILNFKEKKPLKAQTKVIEALGYILKDEQIDSYVKSSMLSLPANSILAQEEPTVLPEAFYAAKSEVIKSFVKTNLTEIQNLYKKHHAMNSIGDRALKNLLLDYLTEADATDIDVLLKKQYTESNNMTDTLSALENLVNSKSEFRTVAIEDFYSKWSEDSVVFNKWLQVLATSTRHSDTFDLVKACTQRKAFDKNNPNNLYALHRNFGENLLHFQKSDGQPYQWMADEIIRIDQFNPQVAARLSNCFSLTKKLPTDLQQKSKNEIQRVLQKKDLSGNTREILEKYVN